HTRSKRDWSSDVCSSDLGSEITLNATIPPSQTFPGKVFRGEETEAQFQGALRGWAQELRPARPLDGRPKGRSACFDAGLGSLAVLTSSPTEAKSAFPLSIIC